MINKHLFHFILDQNFHYFGVELWIFLEQEEVHLVGSVLVEYLSLFGEIVSKPIEEYSFLHLLEPVVWMATELGVAVGWKMLNNFVNQI